MTTDIFTFTLYTETDLNSGGIFEVDGAFLGRILKKRTSYRDDAMYSYDIESKIEIFEKLQSGEIKLFGIEKYHISNSSIKYTHKDI